jgi:hypothetical protein
VESFVNIIENANRVVEVYDDEEEEEEGGSSWRWW